MHTSRYTYNGKVWSPCPTTSDSNSFFHSSFGMKIDESEIYFDKQAKFRRMRWAAFLTYFENENMPSCLADILRKCLSADDKLKHVSIDDKQKFSEYVSGVMAADKFVTKEEIPILATLENTKIVVLSDAIPESVIIIEPNVNIFGSYPTVPEKPKEVVLRLEGNMFSRLEVVNEDSIKKSDEAEVERKIHRENAEASKMYSIRYKKGGSAGSKGVQYQVSLLAVVLLNALKNLKNWRLSTENDDAGKFDDVVLECSDGATFIQSKHKESKKKRITVEELISTNSKNDDFSLPKYFLSYLLIKKKFIVKNVIICSNADVHEKAIHFLNRREAYPESLLHDEASNYYFYTLKDEAIQVFRENVKKYYQQNFKNKGIEESEINDRNLKHFLEHLQIYFNYFSQKSIDKVVDKLLSTIKYCNKSINKIFNSDICSKLMDWFQQKDGIYLTDIHAKAMFAEIWRDKYCQKLEHYKILFQRNDLTFQGREQIYHISTSFGHLLQTIEIYHTLKDDKIKTLFINSNDNIDIQKLTVEVFCLPQYVFLVIIWSNITVKFLTEEIFTKLKHTLKQHKNKKIILVGESNTLFQQIVYNNDTAHLDRSVTFEDLSSVSQEWIIKKRNVIFQGKRVTLEELLSLETVTDYGKYLNTEILENLLKGEEIKVGTLLSDLNEHTNQYYINRSLTRKLIVMQNEKLEGEEDRRILDNEVKDETFREEEIYNVKEKFVLIADAAGMGKSTILHKLALIVKKNYPCLWVVRVILNDFTRILRDSLRKARKFISIKELLNTKNETMLTNHLEECIFSSSEKVVLMLDGVDEVSPDYTELILNMLKQCKEEYILAKVFVTTRPHIVKDLEAVLKVKSFILEPFTQQNQVDFLTNYWAHNLKLKDDKNIEKCERYAQSLISNLSLTNLGNSIEYHVGIVPLHVRMIADIFQENTRLKSLTNWGECKQYLMEDESELKLRERMNVTKIYDLFIEKKRDIFLDKGNPSGNTTANQALMEQFNECLDYHRSLALEVVLGEDKFHYFFRHHRSGKNIEKNILKIGVVQKLNGKLHFVHRTFADYFVADCLLRELQQNQTCEFQTFLIDTIFLRPQFNITRIFFDSLLQKIVDFLPSNIFNKYQSVRNENFQQLYMLQSKLIHLLAEEGNIAILQLILQCIHFNSIQDKNISDRNLYETNKNKDEQKIIFGNTLNVLQHLTEQFGINITDENGWTPLHFAARQGRLEMIHFLTERGAIFNNTNKSGSTVLHLATTNGQLETVKYLLEHDVDSNVKNNNGFTALHSAVQYGQLDIMKSLVESGLDFNDRGIKGTSLLHLASANGNLKIVKYLLELGIDPYITNDGGDTVLHIAAQHGRLNVLKFLVEYGVDFNSINNRGVTLLHYASSNGHLDVIKYLLELGADPNITNNDDDTVLHTAAQHGKLEVLKFFRKYGLDFNCINIRGVTLLHFASANGRLEVMKYLLEFGVSPNTKQNGGKTVLHSAIQYGQFGAVKFLIESGADFHIANSSGTTPLHYACANGKLEVLKYLLELGADPNITDNYGDTVLHTAAQYGRLDALKFLVEYGVDYNSTNSRGTTILHVACAKDRLEVIKYLFELGVDPNIKQNDGGTVLHSAAQYGQLNVVKFLVEYGVDFNISNNHGVTPLQFASANSHLEIVKYLSNLVETPI